MKNVDSMTNRELSISMNTMNTYSRKGHIINNKRYHEVYNEMKKRGLLKEKIGGGLTKLSEKVGFAVSEDNLNKLTKREKDVLMFHYGINTEPLFIGDIVQKIEVISIERVRQILEKAIRRVKMHRRFGEKEKSEQNLSE